MFCPNSHYIPIFKITVYLPSLDIARQGYAYGPVRDSNTGIPYAYPYLDYTTAVVYRAPPKNKPGSKPSKGVPKPQNHQFHRLVSRSFLHVLVLH